MAFDARSGHSRMDDLKDIVRKTRNIQSKPKKKNDDETTDLQHSKETTDLQHSNETTDLHQETEIEEEVVFMLHKAVTVELSSSDEELMYVVL